MERTTENRKTILSQLNSDVQYQFSHRTEYLTTLSTEPHLRSGNCNFICEHKFHCEVHSKLGAMFAEVRVEISLKLFSEPMFWGLNLPLSHWSLIPMMSWKVQNYVNIAMADFRSPCGVHCPFSLISIIGSCVTDCIVVRFQVSICPCTAQNTHEQGNRSLYIEPRSMVGGWDLFKSSFTVEVKLCNANTTRR